MEDALGEPVSGRLPPHGDKDTIRAAVVRLGSFLRNPFSFLFARSSAEERVAAYVIREHHRGRRLDEILQDRYVQNRLSPQQQLRLLDRPEVIRAIGDDSVQLARETLSPLRTQQPTS